MNKDKERKISKSLSYWLRHHPHKINLTLEDDGWVKVDDLIEKSKSILSITLDELKYVVENNDKQRFSFNEDFSKIRANQGHSVEVKMEFDKVVPPQILFHGTSSKFIDSIKKEGLKSMRRHHVHLSKDTDTATKVGVRKGKDDVVILQIEAMKMRAEGFQFYKSDNGVYLVDDVPSKYIKFN